MRQYIALAALMCAAITSAQVFEPVRLKGERTVKKNSILLQTSQFDWDAPGVSGELGFLLAGDFALSDEFGLGFWLTKDRQSDFSGSVDLTWLELHVTWLFSQQPNSSFGVYAGGIAVDIEDFDQVSWSSIGVVGSTRLDPNAPDGSKWGLGYNVGRLFGQESGSGTFVTFDGWSYGLNLAYDINESWSLNSAWWVMDLDGSGAARISRFNFGVGFRF